METEKSNSKLVRFWGTSQDPNNDPFELRNQWKAQIFSPAYGGSNGWKTNRPTISSCPTEIYFGEEFSVSASFASSRSFGNVTLISLGATTHGFNENQRWVQLVVAGSGTTRTVTAPTSPKVAPPGYYMLFVLDNLGVPSEAKIVRLRDFAPVYIGDNAGSFLAGGPAFPPAYGSSLFLPENGYLGSYVYSSHVEGTHTIEMEVWGYHTTTAAQVLRFVLEGKVTQAADLEVFFYDWGASGYESVATTSWSADAELSQTFLAGNYGEPVGTHRFIRSSDKKILVKLKWTRGSSSFQGRFDLMEIGVR